MVLGGEIRIMVVGTTLIKLDGSDYYSPSFPRGGLAGTFAVDVTHIRGLSAFDISVEHRDETDTSFTGAAVSFTTITAAGHSEVDVTGLKQILRFKYTLTGSNDYDGVHFFMQVPSWRPG